MTIMVTRHINLVNDITKIWGCHNVQIRKHGDEALLLLLGGGAEVPRPPLRGGQVGGTVGDRL